MPGFPLPESPVGEPATTNEEKEYVNILPNLKYYIKKLL